ncbi:hypothetical protein [Paenibacillus sp. HB172176]|uniref:hypothetical protein n=1 Tax=Paenibacillus sp. HB172176 TaxID=2493690 RepID=UPI00143C8651|nr:hypothetical protein [Paenibacillus sp. HB172176]
MKRIMKWKLLLIVVMSLVLVFLAACSKNGNEGNKEATENGGSTGESEPVHLTWGIQGDTKANDSGWPYDTIQEMEKQLNIKFDIVDLPEEKLKLMLSSGTELPDIITTGNQDIAKQMIEGGLVIAMDPYLEQYGSDIVNNFPLRANFSRKSLSDSSENLYWVPFQAGNDGFTGSFGVGYFTRWDYFKELGAPVIGSDEEYLKMIAEMVKAHPTTEDGKKTYGFGLFTDWNKWPYVMLKSSTNFVVDCNAGFCDVRTNEIVDMYNDGDNILWQSLQFYNKANQMGIFDTDSLVQKYADYTGKITGGQYMSVLGSWMFNDFNTAQAQKDPNTLAAYEPIPIEGMSAYANANYEAGLANRLVGITKSSKNPAKAVELINFLNSYDGIRLLQSGIQGVHWDMVDGKPQMKEEVLKAAASGDDKVKKEWGLQFDVNFAGISPGETHPDGAPLSLFNTTEAWKLSMTAADKDFAEHYGAETKNDVYINLKEEGKFFDISTWKTGINALLESPPDDIKRIGTQLEEIWLRGAPSAILAKTDEEFEAAKQDTLKKLKAAGSEKYWAWYQEAWENAKSKYAEFAK